MSTPSAPHIPPALSARLASEQQQFGNTQTKEELEESLRKAAERHEAFEREKSQRGAGEVEHAKAVARAHHEMAADNEALNAKRATISKNQSELKALEERIAAADEKERKLRAQLESA